MRGGSLPFSATGTGWLGGPAPVLIATLLYFPRKDGSTKSVSALGVWISPRPVLGGEGRRVLSYGGGGGVTVLAVSESSCRAASFLLWVESKYSHVARIVAADPPWYSLFTPPVSFGQGKTVSSRDFSVISFAA